jgi:hypothetical protein
MPETFLICVTDNLYVNGHTVCVFTKIILLAEHFNESGKACRIASPESYK